MSAMVTARTIDPLHIHRVFPQFLPQELSHILGFPLSRFSNSLKLQKKPEGAIPINADPSKGKLRLEDHIWSSIY